MNLQACGAAANGDLATGQSAREQESKRESKRDSSRADAREGAQEGQHNKPHASTVLCML